MWFTSKRICLERGVVHPSLMLWLDPCVLFQPHTENSFVSENCPVDKKKKLIIQFNRVSQPFSFLPARASEQGNVIGSVSVYIYIYIYIYIYMSSKKNCN